jgi:hypothetical protein
MGDMRSPHRKAPAFPAKRDGSSDQVEMVLGRQRDVRTGGWTFHRRSELSQLLVRITWMSR